MSTVGMRRSVDGVAMDAPRSGSDAIAFLAAAASDTLEAPSAEAIDRAATMALDSLHQLESVQLELTSALVTSQDRILAMKTLAKINVQGIASDQTIGLLLDKARTLTGSTVVELFEGETVTASSGDDIDKSQHIATVIESVSSAPTNLLRHAASDSAIVATVDPDGQQERYIAFFREPTHPFSTTDIPLIEAIVSALGVMIAFNELHERELRKAAVEREHQLASALAQSIITDRPPHTAAARIFARTTPASLAGGDFYVFGQMDGAVWFAVGDVAGKGLPAAMLMTRAVAACRVAFLAHRDATVDEVFARIADELFDHLDDAGVFITMVVGVLDEATRTVSLANAGHSPIVYVHNGTAEFVPATAPPLGVLRDRRPTVTSLQLTPDSTLVLGSDGLAEQSNPDDLLFGYDNFKELCVQTSHLSPDEMGEAVLSAIDEFAAGQIASDDATLVILGASALPSDHAR